MRRLGLQVVGRTLEASKLLPAKQAFRILDPDGNGYITEDNLVEVWEHFCKKAFVFVRMSWAWFLCKCAINVTEERVSKPSGYIYFFFLCFLSTSLFLFCLRPPCFPLFWERCLHFDQSASTSTHRHTETLRRINQTLGSSESRGLQLSNDATCSRKYWGCR